MKFKVEHFHDPTAQKAQVKQFKRGALPAKELAYFTIDNEILFPCVTVEAANRTDLTDLPRIYKTELPETGGDIEAKWAFALSPFPSGPCLAKLTISMVSPVKVAFTLLFDLEKHFDFLEVMADYGILGVLFAPLPPEKSLAFHCDGPTLRGGLKVYALGKLVSGLRKGLVA